MSGLRIPKLVLHPATDTAAPAPAALFGFLSDSGFIGTRFDLDGHTHCYTGADFLAGVSFLGCAPAIQLDPPASPTALDSAARAGDFCHVRVHSPTDTPRLRCRPEQPPRCRRCRAAIPVLSLPATGSASCPECGNACALADLNWRQSGGYARLFLDIWGIHTAEAVPSDRFLDGLAQLGAGPWRFFYTED